MFGLYFTNSVPTSYADMMKSDNNRFNRFFHLMLEKKASILHLPLSKLDLCQSLMTIQSSMRQFEVADKAFSALTMD